MVTHIVHKDTEGKLAVLAVLITAGKENQLINTLWNNLPHDKGEELDLDNIKVNAADLLPTDQKYYTLLGSLRLCK
jgi:carbonic anhydrase